MPVFVAYQMMYATITPALITGASTNQVTVPVHKIFLTLWLPLVYFPFMHVVWGVHGMGGILGIVLLGVLASKSFNPNGVDGLPAGNASSFGKQVAAVCQSSVWAFDFICGMLWLNNQVTVVRVSEVVTTAGLDAALHGEQAYIELT